MHVDEFIFNCCVSSMISDDIPVAPEECATNVFSIDENKIRDANGIIFAEAITCYKCTFCGKMFAAMEVVLTHYQSNHRCSVIPLLKGMKSMPKISTPKLKIRKNKSPESAQPLKRGRPSKTSSAAYEMGKLNELRNTRSNIPESPSFKKLRLLRESTENQQKFPIKLHYKKEKTGKNFACRYPGCERKFTYHNSLLSHRKTHKLIKLKSYKCNWNDCEFTCSDAAGLEFHKRTHSGDNPYKCSWPGCDKSFADASAKDQHLQKEHIGDKTLQCDYPGCCAKFKFASERDRHKATHLGKKISAPVPVTRKMPQLVFNSSSDSDDVDDDDEDEEEEEEEEEVENENVGDLDNNKNLEIRDKIDVEVDSEPLDLSKNSDSIKETKKEEKTETVDKTNQKVGQSKTPKKTIPKTQIFRCDYPGCRKTFHSSDELKQHEKDTHKTSSAEGRSRYERRCKGNLYYKI